MQHTVLGYRPWYSFHLFSTCEPIVFKDSKLILSHDRIKLNQNITLCQWNGSSCIVKFCEKVRNEQLFTLFKDIKNFKKMDDKLKYKFDYDYLPCLKELSYLANENK